MADRPTVTVIGGANVDNFGRSFDSLRESGVEVRSMGRSVDDDPVYFLAAGSAGVLAGRMAARSQPYKDMAKEAHSDQSPAG